MHTAEHLAPVIDLQEWRYSGLPPAERAEVQRQHAAARPAPRRAPDWSTLAWASQTDARDVATLIARLGGHPIAVHGVTREGGCTCRRAECDAVGKHPVERAWQKTALDVRRLDALLQERWALNIGWRMGRQPSGMTLIAIDVDGDRSLLEPIEREHGPLPQTLTAKSAKGWHFIFRVPEDRTIGNRVRLAPGVDVRGEGGQIVIAPSRHASGARYRWVDAREPAVLT